MSDLSPALFRITELEKQIHTITNEVKELRELILSTVTILERIGDIVVDERLAKERIKQALNVN